MSIHEVAKEFAQELAKFHTKMDFSSYKTSQLTLTVRYSTEGGPKMEVMFGEYNGPRHTDLGKLMDEVYRRAGFDDRAEGTINAESNSLLSLPSPEEIPW